MEPGAEETVVAGPPYLSHMRLPETPVRYGTVGALIITLTGLLLFYQTDDPFEPAFNLGLALLLLGGFLTGLVPALMLAGAHHRWLRLPGIFASLGVILAGLFVISLSVNYRWLLWREVTPEARRADLRQLAEFMRERHPGFAKRVAPEEFNRAVAELDAQILQLDPARIHMAEARLVALLHDGHSEYFPFQPASGFHMAPVELYSFSDGWYVIGASPLYRDLVGRRITRIGDKTPDEAYALMRPYIGSDNEWTIKDRMPMYLVTPEALAAVGIASRSETVELTLADEAGGTSRISLAPVSLVRYFYWLFRPLETWKRKRTEDPSLPLYRQHPDLNYWFTYLPQAKTVYVCFRQVRDQGQESIAEFGHRVLQYSRQHPVERLVIDVRGNSGGDNSLFPDFIRELASSPANQRGRLFTIIGRHTFSAAVNFVSAMERQTQTLFAGEPTGAGPNHYGDTTKYFLPNSHAVVFLSTRYHEWGEPADRRTSHDPQIPISLSHDDYFGNRDPVLDAVLAYH